MIPKFNQEHFEAAQEETNRIKEGVIKELSDEGKEKMAAVEEAVNLLVKHKINFYLFPELETIDTKNNKKKKFKTVWQWNSLASFAEYDKSGKLTEKSREQNAAFHESFIYYLYCLFSPAGFDQSTPWNGFVSYLWMCVSARLKYMRDLFEIEEE